MITIQNRVLKKATVKKAGEAGVCYYRLLCNTNEIPGEFWRLNMLFSYVKTPPLQCLHNKSRLQNIT